MQQSNLAKPQSHTRDLLWEMDKKRKDLIFLDSTVECRPLALRPNNRKHNEGEVISPIVNPYTAQKWDDGQAQNDQCSQEALTADLRRR